MEFLGNPPPIGKFHHCLLAIRTGTIMAMTMSLSLLVMIAMMTRLTCTTTGSILGSNLFATMWFCWFTCKILMFFYPDHMITITLIGIMITLTKSSGRLMKPKTQSHLCHRPPHIQLEQIYKKNQNSKVIINDYSKYSQPS